MKIFAILLLLCNFSYKYVNFYKILNIININYNFNKKKFIKFFINFWNNNNTKKFY